MNTQNQTISQERRKLHAKGYTVRRAARALGVTHCHLSQVIAGKRKSARLMERLHALPECEFIPRERVTA